MGGKPVTVTGRPPAIDGAAPKPKRRHRKLRIAGLVLVVALTPVAWSLGHALTAPGNDSFSARVAEWARGHHGGWLVTWLEKKTYVPPRVGGTPAATSPLRTQAGSPPAPPPAAALPTAIRPPAYPPLPGEGHWHVLATVGGRAALAVSYLRPDSAHTSYTAGVVWIRSSLVRAVFHPGTQQPGGGRWPIRPKLVGADRVGLLAAFNSAFRLQDSRGGFYGFGKTVQPLRDGAASMVLTSDGKISVGAWSRDVGMSASVQAVRQNLALIVDHGRPAPDLGSNVHGKWGYTLGNAFYVWRSGIGVTRTGDVVFATGNRLSAASLADLLVRAGAMRAMELDINPEWTSFVLYPNRFGSATERNLLPDMQRSPRRYDSTSTRDFIALYAR
jgi:hypothetical protein